MRSYRHDPWHQRASHLEPLESRRLLAGTQNFADVPDLFARTGIGDDNTLLADNGPSYEPEAKTTG